MRWVSVAMRVDHHGEIEDGTRGGGIAGERGRGGAAGLDVDWTTCKEGAHGKSDLASRGVGRRDCRA